MSTPNDPSGAGLEGILQFGQSLAQNFFQFLSQQSAASGQGAAIPEAVILPGAERLMELQRDLASRHASLWSGLMQKKPGETSPPQVAPQPGDRRFAAPEWAESPVFDYLRQAYLLNAEYLSRVSDSLPIEDGRTKERIQFLTRQYVDAMAPSNFAATNPEFLKTAVETKGESITRGIKNLLADLEKGRISMTDDAAFEVGRNLAITPGSVIYENQLIQLIQYSPLTEKVHQTPLLIVPPCINKFYIMDLQPANSLVRFIVEQGFTVFLVSWKNAGPEDARTGWDDYLQLGPIAALEVVRDVTRVKKPHVLGFCVGGTILSSALAVLKGRGEDPVSSLTLMTTLLDFADPGELGCLIDENSVAAKEASIGKGGLLKGQELANVFSSLRANDLIWQYVVGNYLKGNKPQAFDLLYWNSDSTNLPGPFLAWYLRNMYLENNLRVPGKLKMLGVKVDLGKVDVPAYLLATREDHIVPWTSAYLARGLLGGDTTFVLGASGHIAGAINPASKNRRSYWVSDSNAAAPDEWLESASEQPGSWWSHWMTWLKPKSGKEVKARGRLGSPRNEPIEPAPGRYVKAKA
ncbi:MAG TPA: class I poly(R)-hydroxyalkanoic acid synthase [Nitrospira sp.]|uniref:PHA/PHB synthase family protein n=1 Tax=Cognatazoarcus halotolerans TaxID=2686016 RepID=UPI001358FB51|nr:class I poly(R)-hydroxyalkanoic acid synthase [Cognatazoarcus halotolerans]MBX3680246.1 class I poly(R)-hydroxyalkanoic acid synthase [Rhodocyclaceae bacterium]MCB1902371.1 class I poly(R)-hydroxyalkanoic acid synthase [Rhodocyclaceae bacterium]MCP5309661.1 class I poly(R)-hydroxyalkanoic acid synthase [Zoogloeaceae bacterium]HQV11992.1 class I poly(R)-hydroxyalkanoic acid synthase [Nitrospira sp.]